MKKKNDMLIMLIIIFIGSSTFLFINLPEIELFWLIISILSGILIITGIISIENNPPHIGLITLLDKKIWRGVKPVVIGEGLNWVFLRGIIYNVIPINNKLKQKEFEPQKILTPDNVDVKVPISYSYYVDPEESHTYINIGEEKGVDEAIKKTLEGRLREYSRHPEEGPMTWREMIASGLKTLDYLIKGLCKSEETIVQNGYDHLVKISDEIPTPILLDWYRQKDPPNSVVRKQWGDGKTEEEENEKREKEKKEKVIPSFEKNWKNLEDIINVLAGVNNHENPEANEKKVKDFKKKLNGKIKNRIDLLEKLQLGKANAKIPNLGIYLVRLTIGDVDPSGAIYEAEIALQREEKERNSETYEVETDLAKAIVLKKAIKKMHKKDADIIECFNAIMKWKMIGDGKGFVYDGQLGTFAGLGDLISSVMKGGKK